MQIDHIAIWVTDLEKMKTFYETYFNASANDKYTNESKGFSSYFLRFDSGARIELMTRGDVTERLASEGFGYTHLAMRLNSRDEVNVLTETLRTAGITIASEPRLTGDGYYESAILDPENNGIELVAESS